MILVGRIGVKRLYFEQDSGGYGTTSIETPTQIHHEP